MQPLIRTAGRSLLLVAMLVSSVAIVHSASAAEDTAWLGVVTQTMTPELREGLDFKYVGDGALVSRVVVGSPAEKAGIKKGDIVTSVGSKTITSSRELANAVAALKTDQYATVRVVRNGSSRNFNVQLGSRSEELGDDIDGELQWRSAPVAPRAPRAPNAPEVFEWHGSGDDFGSMRTLDKLRDLQLGDIMLRVNRGRLGVRIENLNPDLAGYFGGTSQGALVVEVMKDTPAERAGIKAGDVITKVGTTAIGDTDDLMEALRDKRGTVTLSVVRKGATRTIEAELEERSAPRAYRFNSGDGTGSQRLLIDGSNDRDALKRELDDMKRQLEEIKRELEQNKK